MPSKRKTVQQKFAMMNPNWESDNSTNEGFGNCRSCSSCSPDIIEFIVTDSPALIVTSELSIVIELTTAGGVVAITVSVKLTIVFL